MPAPDRNLTINLDSYAGDYENIVNRISLRRAGDTLLASVEGKMGAPVLFPENSPLAFVDKRNACLDTGDSVVDRMSFIFSEFDKDRPGFLFTGNRSGLRQLKRV